MRVEFTLPRSENRFREPPQARMMGIRGFRVVLAGASLASAALCLAGEPVRIEGLRHSWNWEEGGWAARITCIAAPTGECYFRLHGGAASPSVERVQVGHDVTFRFGSLSASYCVAVVAAKDAPCEHKFITAGFHFSR